MIGSYMIHYVWQIVELVKKKDAELVKLRPELVWTEFR